MAVSEKERPGKPRPFALPRELLVFHALGFDRIRAQTADLVFFVILEVALEEFDMGVALKRQDMRAQAVEEEAVVRDDDRAAGEIFDRGFQRLQGLDRKSVV